MTTAVSLINMPEKAQPVFHKLLSPSDLAALICTSKQLQQIYSKNEVWLVHLTQLNINPALCYPSVHNKVCQIINYRISSVVCILSCTSGGVLAQSRSLNGTRLSLLSLAVRPEIRGHYTCAFDLLQGYATPAVRGTSIAAAAAQGHERIVMRLFEYGFIDEHYRLAALSAASSKGHQGIVRLLEANKLPS